MTSSIADALAAHVVPLTAASRECTAPAGGAASTCALEVELRLGTRRGARVVGGLERAAYELVCAEARRAADGGGSGALHGVLPGAATLRQSETLDVYDETRQLRYAFAVGADGAIDAASRAAPVMVHKTHVFAAVCGGGGSQGGGGLQMRLAAALERQAAPARAAVLVREAASVDYTLRRKSRLSLALAGGALVLELTRVVSSKARSEGGSGAPALALLGVLEAWSVYGEAAASAGAGAGVGAGAPVVSYECELEYVLARDGAAAPLRRRELSGVAFYFDAVVQRLAAVLAPRAHAPAPALVLAAPLDLDARLLAAPWLEALSGDGGGGAEAAHVLQRVRELSAQAAPADARAHVLRARGFAGAMPVALRRADLAGLDTRVYMVAEKSNGVRARLYMCCSGGGVNGGAVAAYLVDRRNRVLRVHGCQALRALQLPELLLDGELVENLRAGAGADVARRHTYLAFDLVSETLRGGGGDTTVAVSPAALFFYERLESIARSVVAPLRALEAGAPQRPQPPPPLPFELCGKPYWPLAALAQLLVRVRGGAHEGRYADARRCHASDGLMLVPNERGVRPLTCARTPEHAATFKLKFCHSVDLVVRHAPLRLCCLESGGTGAVNPSVGAQAAAAAAAAELEVAGAGAIAARDVPALERMPAGTIVECVYGGPGPGPGPGPNPGAGPGAADAGVWRLVGVRAKSAPNHVAVVLDTLLARLDAVSIADLQARVAADAAAAAAAQ